MERLKWNLFGVSFEEDLDIEGKFIKEDSDIDNRQRKSDHSNDIKEIEDNENDKIEDSENEKVEISGNRNFYISDVVCDMHLVLSMRNLMMKADITKDQKVLLRRNLALVSQLLIEYIWMAKNVIIKIRKKHSSLTGEGELNPDFIEQLHFYIEEIREVINNRKEPHERIIHADDLLKMLNEEEIIFQEVVKALENLENRVRFYEQSHGDAWFKKNIKSGIYFAIRNLPDALGARYKESNKLMKYMNRFYRYRPRRADYLTTQMIINGAKFNNHINNIVDSTVNDMCAIQEKVCKNTETPQDLFINEINNMRGYIKKTRDDFGSYRGTGNGCFALMDLKYSSDKSKQIFAFSSMFDCDDNDIRTYFGITDVHTRKGLREKLIYMQKEILIGAEWAKTVKEMKRYLFDLNNKFPKTSETIDDAIRKNSAATEKEKERIRSDFNCCERKMIPKINNNLKGIIKECNLFTRHSICPKCEPEIEDFKNDFKIGSIHSYFVDNEEISDKIV